MAVAEHQAGCTPRFRKRPRKVGFLEAPGFLFFPKFCLQHMPVIALCFLLSWILPRDLGSEDRQLERREVGAGRLPQDSPSPAQLGLGLAAAHSLPHAFRQRWRKTPPSPSAASGLLHPAFTSASDFCSLATQKVGVMSPWRLKNGFRERRVSLLILKNPRCTDLLPT